MTLFFKSHQIEIRRPKLRGTNRYAFSATYTAYSADIQPTGPDRAIQVGGRIGKVWDAWIDATVDVREGDQVVTSGRRYSVRAVSTYQSAGLLDHKQLILVSQDDG